MMIFADFIFIVWQWEQISSREEPLRLSECAGECKHELIEQLPLVERSIIPSTHTWNFIKHTGRWGVLCLEDLWRGKIIPLIKILGKIVSYLWGEAECAHLQKQQHSNNKLHRCKIKKYNCEMKVKCAHYTLLPKDKTVLMNVCRLHFNQRDFLQASTNRYRQLY